MPKRRRKTIKNYPSRQGEAEAAELRITNKNKKEDGENQPNVEAKVLLARKDEEIDSAPADSTAEPKNEKIERDKKLLMWVGVSCLMVIFFAAWIFNLKYEFKASSNKSAGNGFSWSQTKAELSQAMIQVKQGLAEIKKIQADLKPSAKAGGPKLTAEQINLLKGKLLDEIATGTASSTKK